MARGAETAPAVGKICTTTGRRRWSYARRCLRRPRPTSLTYLLENLDLRALWKQRLSGQQLAKDAAGTPNVYTSVIKPRAEQQLRWSIPERDDTGGIVPSALESSRQTKIAQL